MVSSSNEFKNQFDVMKYKKKVIIMQNNRVYVNQYVN